MDGFLASYGVIVPMIFLSVEEAKTSWSKDDYLIVEASNLNFW